MHRVIKNAALNFITANVVNSAHVRPLVVTYHLTHRCNLRCFFCEECGIERNHKWEQEGELSTGEAKKMLRMLSRPFALLYITGGEPFLRADAGEIFDEIASLPFKNVTVNTNLTLWERVQRSLHAINNLVVSIDSIDPDRYDEIRGVQGMGKRVLASFEEAVAFQKEGRYRLYVNCVVTPATIDDARKVMHHCVSRGVKVGINAQNDRHGPIKQLLENQEFKDLVCEMMEVKERTRLITGTKGYYEQLFGFQRYTCYPFVTPRINAQGSLAWPCDNLQQWVPGVHECRDWEEAVGKAVARYGRFTGCDKNCQFQCYIEPSKMVKKPWMALGEYL